MTKKYKPVEELRISDDFMFGRVMQEERYLLPLLQKILPHLNITRLTIDVREFTIDEEAYKRGVRLDVYAEDEEKNMYAVEMQMRRSGFSAERVRYIGSSMDISSLTSGEEVTNLKGRYIIFICLFDPFDDNMMVYTIRNMIVETNKPFDDGAATYVINCKAQNAGKFPQLKSFVEYINGEIRGADCDDSYIRELDHAVETAKKDAVFRKGYMDLVEKLKEAKEEGYGEGKIDERSRLIRNVMKSGMPFKNACEILGLSEDEIRECREYLEKKEES